MSCSYDEGVLERTNEGEALRHSTRETMSTYDTWAAIGEIASALHQIVHSPDEQKRQGMTDEELDTLEVIESQLQAMLRVEV